ncbi:MAG: MMPL family transporter [Bdellovibrionales bacterium]|nr:MMPL family transporter [Bdellovibrionales bacterium]
MINQGFINRFVDTIIKYPKISILLSILLLFITGFGATLLKTNFSYRIWFEPDNPKLALFDSFEKRFGSDELSVVTLYSPSGIFDKESAQLLINLTNDMWQTSEVIRVDSLTNFNWVHGEDDEVIVESLIPDDQPLTEELLEERKNIAIHHPSIEGYLINKKADVAVIYVKLKPSFDGSPVYENIVQSIREKVAKYQGQGDHQILLSGTPLLNYAFKESTEKDLEMLVPFVFLVTIAFLIFSFRNLSGVLLPLIVVIATIICTMGATGWVGIEINNITSVVPQFMIAISIAVVVHVLVSFYLFYQKGLSKEEALRAAAVKNFIPTLLTAVSTVIGFWSFSTSPIPPIANMGKMAGLGTAFSWVFTYTMILPLIQLLPLKLKGQANSKMSEGDAYIASPRATYFANLIYKWRKIILGGAVLISVLSIYLALQVPVNSDPFEYFADDYPLSIATDFIEKNLGGAVGSEIVVESGQPEGIKNPQFLHKVDEFQTWLSHRPHITKTVSVVDILKDMNKTLNQGKDEYYRLADDQELIAQQLFLYTMNLPQGMDINDRVTLENDALRITSMWTIHDSETALSEAKNYETKAKEMGLHAYVTGKMPLYHSNNEKVVSSFKISISLAIVLVAILLIFGLQSVRIGLLSILPNALPLLIGAGVVKLVGQPLDIGTVIVGSICLGIAVDDTIHFLANFKKFMLAGVSAKEAVAIVYSTTARALITTTVVIVAAFGTFAMASFTPNQNFGIFVSIILTVALFVDLIFLPALLMSTKTFSPEETVKIKTKDANSANLA